MSNMKSKIMGMTDHSTKTGFGGVMHNIMMGLGETYDAYLLGWGFHYEEPIKRANYTLLPAGGHPFGADVLGQYLMQVKPEVLVTQNDSRMVDWLPNLLSQVPNKPTWIDYPVIDGWVWDADNRQTKWAGDWTAIMSKADKIVAMTEFGQKILKANGLESTVIYHGVDTTLFRPFPQEVKENIKTQIGIKGKFVIGGMFKGILRKHPEKYLQAFSLFRKGIEDKVALVLHTSINQSMGGEMNLDRHCADYGLIIGKDVFFTQQNLPTTVIPNIFNAMDVFWALGTMEGFCLPIVEAMSCGLPIVAVNATTFPELLSGTGILSDIPVYSKSKGAPVTFGSYNGIECPVPNPHDIAAKTETLYSDAKLRETLSMMATERACKVFDWNIIKKQWADLIKSCIISVEDLPAEWKSIYESVK